MVKCATKISDYGTGEALEYTVQLLKVPVYTEMAAFNVSNASRYSVCCEAYFNSDSKT